MDPVALSTIVGVVATFLMSVFQSVKQGHFHSTCTLNKEETKGN